MQRRRCHGNGKYIRRGTSIMKSNKTLSKLICQSLLLVFCIGINSALAESKLITEYGGGTGTNNPIATDPSRVFKEPITNLDNGTNQDFEFTTGGAGDYRLRMSNVTNGSGNAFVQVYSDVARTNLIADNTRNRLPLDANDQATTDLLIEDLSANTAYYLRFSAGGGSSNGEFISAIYYDELSTVINPSGNSADALVDSDALTPVTPTNQLITEADITGENIVSIIDQQEGSATWRTGEDAPTLISTQIENGLWNIADGSPNPAGTWRRLAEIPVEAGEDYILTHQGNRQDVIFMDTNGDFIIWSLLPKTPEGVIAFTPPVGAAFIRVNLTTQGSAYDAINEIPTLVAASSAGSSTLIVSAAANNSIATGADGGAFYDNSALVGVVALNTAKVGITQAQADDIAANNSKVGITPAQATAIEANTAKTVFSGDFGDLQNIPAGLEDGDDDTISDNTALNLAINTIGVLEAKVEALEKGCVVNTVFFEDWSIENPTDGAAVYTTPTEIATNATRANRHNGGFAGLINWDLSATGAVRLYQVTEAGNPYDGIVGLWISEDDLNNPITHNNKITTKDSFNTIAGQSYTIAIQYFVDDRFVTTTPAGIQITFDGQTARMDQTLAQQQDGQIASFSHTFVATTTGTTKLEILEDGQDDASPIITTVRIDDLCYVPTSNEDPIALDQEIEIDQNTTNNDVNLVSTDDDNDALTWVVEANPSYGTLSGTAPNLTYTPFVNFSGIDTFSFKSNDGISDSNTATVSINVNAVGGNLAGMFIEDVFYATSDGRIVGGDDWRILPEITGIKEGDVIEITHQGNRDKAIFMDDSGNLVQLVENLGFTNPRVVTVPAGATALRINVSSGGNLASYLPLNDIPTVIVVSSAPPPNIASNIRVGSFWSTNNGQSVNDSEWHSFDEITGINANDVIEISHGGNRDTAIFMDSEGNYLQSINGLGFTNPRAVTAPAGASALRINIDKGSTYDPAADTPIVQIVSVSTNNAPVAEDISITVNENSNNNPVSLIYFDLDGDELTGSIVNSPQNGTLSGTIPNLTYTPDIGYVGGDAFTYIANDSKDDSNIASASIVVEQIIEGAKPTATNIIISGGLDAGDTLTATFDYFIPNSVPQGTHNYSFTSPTTEYQRGADNTWVIPNNIEGQNITVWVQPVDASGNEGVWVKADVSVTIASGGVPTPPAGAGTAPYEDLLVHANGYAEGIRGGAGGDVVEITNCGTSGYNDLRAALVSADSKWIRFQAGLTCTMSFPTTEDIRVLGNKTIDGRGANITLQKPTGYDDNRFVMFEFHHAGEFIIHNIEFGEVGAVQASHRDGQTTGTIVWSLGGAKVWFDHLTIANVWDDPFFIRDSSGTVSYVDGGNQAKQFIARNSDITYHHNIMDGDDFEASEWLGHDPSYQNNPLGLSRAPYAQFGAKVHQYNNYIDNWYISGGQSHTAELYSHNNVFGRSALSSRAPFVSSSTTGYIYQFNNVRDTPNQSGTPWVQSGNAGFTPAPSNITNPSNVFTPPYSYTAEPVGTSFNSAQAQALITKLKNQAGSQGVNAPQW